ncbi:MAG: tRNA (N(6)-L-threonylcarbamoyladenosine(37)-C(2))-methylthiotransferase MtaB [Bacteroidia bacterium]
MNQPKVCFYTLGCKLNFSETSTIARSFNEKGYCRVEFDDVPDVYVINTCSVTENADKKCRSLVNRALRVSPQAFIAIIGCYAQLKPQEIAQIPGVDLVLGASEKFNLPEYINNFQKRTETEIHACSIAEVNKFVPSFSKDDRTRTFFKVQDGCDYSCSFCTIPLARGASRSTTVAETIEQARKIIQQNNPSEIVLTGVNTGDFGRKQGESFYALIRNLEQLDGVQRFRISSIEPNLLSDEIISFCASSTKFVPHFHIPLQSGSDRILRLMRRRYQRDLYTRRVDAIRAAMPDACIGVDVIVGFPGETDADFRETYQYLVDLPISYLHVFTYSERDNTLAASMPDAVDGKDRAQRSEMLRILSEKKKQAFYRSQLGTERNVLWEAEQHGDSMFGFTDNYIKVRTPWNSKLINTISEVKLLDVDSEGIVQCAELIHTA